jgi:hypothetical protein
MVYLLDDRLRTLCFGDIAIMAEDVDERMIGNRLPIGKTAPFQIGHPFILQSLTKFI